MPRIAKNRCLLKSRWSSLSIVILYWHSTIYKLQSRYQPMLHHTGWGLFFPRKLKTSGNLLPTHPD